MKITITAYFSGSANDFTQEELCKQLRQVARYRYKEAKKISAQVCNASTAKKHFVALTVTLPLSAGEFTAALKGTGSNTKFSHVKRSIAHSFLDDICSYFQTVSYDARCTEVDII